MNTTSDFLLRLRNRLAYGLATQEVLDRLARIGIVIYPYVLVYSPIVTHPKMDPRNKNVNVKLLGEHETSLVATVSERPRPESVIRALLAGASCATALEDGELLGYCWFTRQWLPSPISANSLCELPSDWAYLFDMYVRPQTRGRRLAEHIRGQIHQMLARQGVTHCCGVTLAFNRSSRRHQARMGTLEPELRLLLRAGGFPGLDLRLRRKPWPLRTPFFHVAYPRPSRPEH